jgi:hypothetical protein
MEAARTSRRQFLFLPYSTSQHGEAQNNRLASTARSSRDLKASRAWQAKLPDTQSGVIVQLVN